MQIVDLGGSPVHRVAGLDVTPLDVVKPLSCIADNDCSYGLECGRVWSITIFILAIIFNSKGE